MTLRRLFIIISVASLLVIFTLSAAAQDSPAPMFVSGTFDYTPTIEVWEDLSTMSLMQTTEVEEWSGDISGTGFSEVRGVIHSTGAWEGWITTSFDNAQIGDKTGSIVILSYWYRPSATAQWQGEWMILRGTGELENVHGWGEGWGPGFNPEDPEASPDLFYSGQVIFLEPMSGE